MVEKLYHIYGKYKKKAQSISIPAKNRLNKSKSDRIAGRFSIRQAHAYSFEDFNLDL